MNFESALSSMKSGSAVRRKDKPGCVFYIEPGCYDASPESGGPVEHLIYGVPPTLFTQGGTGVVTRLPRFNAGLGPAVRIDGWVPDAWDLLAEDWELAVPVATEEPAGDIEVLPPEPDNVLEFQTPE